VVHCWLHEHIIYIKYVGNAIIHTEIDETEYIKVLLSFY